jgi:hypothetical protein
VDDCPHAASAENAAQTITRRSRYDALEGESRIVLLDWPSHPVFAEYRSSRLGFRPMNFITLSPRKKTAARRPEFPKPHNQGHRPVCQYVAIRERVGDLRHLQ